MSAYPGAEMGAKAILRELLSYKSAVFALIILGFLIAVSIYAVVAIPYDEAIKLWRAGEETWLKNPRNAAPVWWELFVGKKLPRTIVLSTLEGKGAEKRVESEGGKVHVTITFRFDYQYDDFPKGISIFFHGKIEEKRRPVVKVYWRKPSGDEILLRRYKLRSADDRYYIDQDLRLVPMLEMFLTRKIGRKPEYKVMVERALFAAHTGKLEPMKGEYVVRLEADLEEGEDLDAELIVYGKVHGIAGTDHLRRPLEIALIWGTPIALAFGLTASLAITILQLIIATVSGWYGGMVDSVIQRITEIYMILPFLPILIMVSMFYKLDIWTLLLVVIALSIFGAGVKTTRALVMQIKNYPYVEAALAYGASGKRIIFLYIIPKILPPVVPGLIQAVPSYVFLEAALAFLGLGDPYVPTWGKVINDAFSNGALYKGYYYWVLEPSAMLILTALAFANLGFALDKIVNPKLREL